ncbi:unnamed protein product [Didymodactylos carnosus]|uniref:Uncharacterized protein n=1 Tax=Didymodactylos carnosus TaxID=1234261 RepID=A0A814Q234_9BILA|nr:unnamed protein product [Didymodactylos carnosus]CAF3878283.1 unnamed protein product [Didymodactylos carnosus]
MTHLESGHESASNDVGLLGFSEQKLVGSNGTPESKHSVTISAKDFKLYAADICWEVEPFNIRYTVRTCIRDEESQTSYSGLTATSHCGWIKLAWINKNKRFKGCIHSCDKDGCIQLLN